jgi:hypothetical protein
MYTVQNRVRLTTESGPFGLAAQGTTAVPWDAAAEAG